MKLNIVLVTVAASALMSGAALAQVAEPAAPAVAPATSDPTLPADQQSTATPAPAPAPTGAATSTSVTVSDAATGASVTTTTTTNGPVPDTAENRAKYGGPLSHAGKRSSAKGN